MLAVVCSVLLLCGLTANAASYSETIAKRAIYYAYGAYCDDSDIEDWSCKWCDYETSFEISTVITASKMLAFIGYDKAQSQVVLSFRGTDNIVNWLQDLDYSQESFDGSDTYYVHSGFYDGLTDLYSAGLEDAIISIFETYSGSDLLITGHSLGAALSQISALQLKTSDTFSGISIGDIYSYNFGSPRWANEDLATYYDSQITNNWRMVNYQDPVPKVPGESYGDYGFHHTATEIYYTDYSSLTYQECDGTGEDSDCFYLWIDVDNHLEYMNIEETCVSTTDMAADNAMPVSTFMNVSQSTTDGDVYDEIKHKIKEVPSIWLLVVMGVGWVCCFLFTCMFFCEKRKRKKEMEERNNQYVQFHHEV